MSICHLFFNWYFFCQILQKQNILVTGAAGTIGSEICRQLISQNTKKVVGIDKSEIGIYNLNKKLDNKIIYCLGDVNDHLLVDQIVKKNKIDLIIHTAAYKHVNIIEKNIIKKALIEMGAAEDTLDTIIKEAETKEKDANQILEFTREVKNKSFEEKKIVIEALWTIIYSDEQADMYETNLMRRLSGLLYLDAKVVGDIKEKIKSNQ